MRDFEGCCIASGRQIVSEARSHDRSCGIKLGHGLHQTILGILSGSLILSYFDLVPVFFFYSCDITVQ